MRLSFRIDGSGCILFALLLLVLPVNWLASSVAAAVFHEICHAAAIWLTGGRIWGLCIGATGIFMETSPMETGQELFCALAGPAGSFLLVFLLPVCPRLAICAGIQGLFNLLPVYPMDGGRVLQAACQLIFSDDWSKKICSAAKWAVVMAAIVAALVATFRYKAGIFPVLLAGFLLSKVLEGKIPCKEGNLAVQ